MTAEISPSTHTERSEISCGAKLSPLLMQIYAAPYSRAIARKGYFIMPGVLAPMPSSRSTVLLSILPINFSYLRAAARQPSSSTKASSTRRLGTMGAPHTGQRGTSEEGIFISRRLSTMAFMLS